MKKKELGFILVMIAICLLSALINYPYFLNGDSSPIEFVTTIIFLSIWVGFIVGTRYKRSSLMFRFSQLYWLITTIVFVSVILLSFLRLQVLIIIFALAFLGQLHGVNYLISNNDITLFVGLFISATLFLIVNKSKRNYTY